MGGVVVVVAALSAFAGSGTGRAWEKDDGCPDVAHCRSVALRSGLLRDGVDSRR